MVDSALPSRRARLGVSALIGVTAAAYVLVFYRHQSPLAVSDFDAIWTAARALWARHDPYAAIPSPPWPWNLQYPLPAVLIALPFSVLPLTLARAVFMGVSSALLAYGLTTRAWWPLIGLAGGQMFFALQSVQWALVARPGPSGSTGSRPRSVRMPRPPERCATDRSAPCSNRGSHHRIR